MRAIGYGAGTATSSGAPNVLRVVIGERVGRRRHLGRTAQAVVKIECEIDDMNPQLFGPLIEHLLAAGALDVFLTAVQMKKGRPGTLVTVLARPIGCARRSATCSSARRRRSACATSDVERETLERRWVDVAVDGGSVRIKVASRRGEVLNAAPEFDDCVRWPRRRGLPVKDVQAAAMRAWLDRRSRH